jgi:hypothetical protein
MKPSLAVKSIARGEAGRGGGEIEVVYGCVEGGGGEVDHTPSILRASPFAIFCVD